MDAVGPKIREIREARGLLQKELAGLAQMNPSNLSKLERGEYTWTKDNLGRLAVALGVDMSAFFADEPKVPLIGFIQTDSKESIPPAENWRILNAIDFKLERILNVVEDQKRWNGVERRKSQVVA